MFDEGTRKGPQTVNMHLGKEVFQLRFYYDRDAMRHHLNAPPALHSVHLGPNDPKTLATMHELGRANRFDDNPKAIQVLGDLVARSSATFGPGHDKTMWYKDSLAQAYELAEKPSDAVMLRKDNYMLTKNKSGADSNDTLYRSDSLAAAYEQAGRIEDALRQREESLRGRRKLAAGSIDRSVAEALREVARLFDRMQDYARAEPLWREALLFFKDNEFVLDDLQESLGRCLLHTGKPADAEPILRQCLAIREKTQPDNWTTFDTKALLGAALLGQKKYPDAEPLLLAGYEGMKQREKTMPTGDKDRLPEAADRLVHLYDATGKKDEAAKWRKIREQSKTVSKAPATATIEARP